MPAELKLKIQKDENGHKIGIIAEQEGRTIILAGPCQSKEELQGEIGVLGRKLEVLLHEAEAAFKEMLQSTTDMGIPEAPEGIWRLLERTIGLEEMKALFNSLPEGKRRQVADFILSHVNVFKGPGATFAQHYEEESASLV